MIDISIDSWIAESENHCILSEKGETLSALMKNTNLERREFYEDTFSVYGKKYVKNFIFICISQDEINDNKEVILNTPGLYGVVYKYFFPQIFKKYKPEQEEFLIPLYRPKSIMETRTLQL